MQSLACCLIFIMTDVFSRRKRSEIMTAIKSSGTSPELRTRSAVRKLGYRFKTVDNTLPGKPDIVLRREKVVIFVHGCFWHQHKGCSRCFMPKSNKKYWRTKLERNVQRFRAVRRALNRLGWSVFVIWECQTKDEERLERVLLQKFRRISAA